MNLQNHPARHEIGTLSNRRQKAHGGYWAAMFYVGYLLTSLPARAQELPTFETYLPGTLATHVHFPFQSSSMKGYELNSATM